MNKVERWYAASDKDPAVELWKRRVRRKPRGTLRPLHFQRTLGVVLLARGRKADALMVWDEAAAAVKKGRFDAWFIAACSAALAHWKRGRSELGKFADAHAAISLQPELWNQEAFAREIAMHWREFTKAARSPNPLAVDTMAFHLGHVAFFRVIDVLAPIHKGKVPARATDASMKKALKQIKERLDQR